MPAVALTRRQRAALPGSRHDRVIGVLKWLLPVLAVVVLVTIVVVPLSKAREFSFLLAKDNVAQARERLRLDSAVYRGETTRGEAFTIVAKNAVQRSSAVPVVELTSLSARIALHDGPATVVAPSGQYFLDEDRLQVAGPVKLDSTAGYSVDSASVDIDLASRKVTSSAPVTGTLPLGTFRAGRFSGDIQGQRLVLDGGVHLHSYGRRGKAAR
jgi:lipopolysaccharide export system protein LptC